MCASFIFMRLLFIIKQRFYLYSKFVRFFFTFLLNSHTIRKEFNGMQTFIFTSKKWIVAFFPFFLLSICVCVYACVPNFILLYRVLSFRYRREASITMPFFMQCNFQIKTKEIFTCLNFDINVKRISWVYVCASSWASFFSFIYNFQSRFTYCLFLPFALLCAQFSFIYMHVRAKTKKKDMCISHCLKKWKNGNAYQPSTTFRCEYICIAYSNLPEQERQRRDTRIKEWFLVVCCGEKPV